MSQILLSNGDSQSTPAADKTSFYAKTDKKLYYKTDAGDEVQLLDSTSALASPDYGQRAVSTNTSVIAMTAAVDSTLATNTDYTQITGIFNATPDGVNSGITQQTNSFTIAVSGTYRIEFWANASSSVNNTQLGFKFAVNGVIGLARKPKIYLRTSGEVHPGSAFGYAHFDAGDVVTLWMASTQTANITIEDLVFGAMSIAFD
jgi:hypothetical protein